MGFVVKIFRGYSELKKKNFSLLPAAVTYNGTQKKKNPQKDKEKTDRTKRC